MAFRASGWWGIVVLAAWPGSPVAWGADLTVKVSGDAIAEVGYLRQGDEAAVRSWEAINRIRLTVTPTFRSERGFEYGARMRVRAHRGNRLLDGDRAYLFLRGDFGRLEAGQVVGPNGEDYVVAPANFGTGGIDGDWSFWPLSSVNPQAAVAGFNGAGGGTLYGSATSTKINYYTPRFLGGGDPSAGLYAAFSYAPSIEATGRAQNDAVDRARRLAAEPFPGQNPEYEDGWEAFLRFDGAAGPVGVALAGGLQGGHAREVAAAGTVTRYHDERIWNAGLELAYAGFRVGGSVQDGGRSSYRRGLGDLPRQTVWTAGLSYAAAFFSVGVDYQQGTDAGDPRVTGGRRQKLLAVGGTVIAAPGLLLGLEYLRNAMTGEAGSGSGPERDADLVLLRTRIVF